MPEVEQRMRDRLAVGAEHATRDEERCRLSFHQHVALGRLRLEERPFGLARRRLAARLRQRVCRPHEHGCREAAPMEIHGCLRTKKTYAKKAIAEQMNMTVAIGTGPRLPIAPTAALAMTPNADCVAPRSDDATPARSPNGAIATEV